VFTRLFLLLALLPVVEIVVLVWIATKTSPLFVFGLIIGTGVLGAWLARHQGLQSLRRIQAEVAAGRMPAEALVDGMLVLVAAVLLIIPGLLSDVMAIALLFPPSRNVLKGLVRRRLRMRVVTMHSVPTASGHDEIIDVKVIDSPPRQPPH
jgi:UPF0716 protein FxsA